MPRPLRIIYPHACYHVMNRGADRQKIFNNNHHRAIFINLLRQCCKIFNINIYAYCLMDNHYHLLISTPDANLSRVMRHINGVYTQTFNRLSKRDGSLFRGRYLAKLVDEDCYQLLVTRYIHLNPVEAGIVENPADYRWSSYRAYLGLAKDSDWLAISSINNQLKQTSSLSHIKSYKDYVENSSLEEINVFTSSKYTSSIFGSVRFKEDSIKRVESPYFEACATDINRTRTIPSLQLIMESVCQFYKINLNTLIKSKSGTINIPKLVFIYLCKVEFGHMLRDIGRFVGFTRYESTSAAVRKCERESKLSPDIEKQIYSISNYIRNALLETNKVADG